MAPIMVKIALLFLSSLCLCRPQADAYKGSSNYRKDAKFGRPVLAMANSPRCMFNGRNVDDGRTVSSPEPCLNCTCSKGILLCYLRTCSTVVASPGCQVVRRKGECCPKLECSRGTTEYRTERTSEPSYKYRLRQDEETFFGLLGMDPRTDRSEVITTTTTTRKPSPKVNLNDDWPPSKINRPSPEFQSPLMQEEDYGSDELSTETNESAGYCYSKGYKYTEGMAMLSPTKCEYCYCIRGQQMCVRPKCHLNIDGCVARFQSGYTCCPSHYQCEIGAQGVNGDEYQLTTNPDGIPSNKVSVSSCNVEGYDFDVGVAVPSSGHCQTCYCTQVGVLCRRLECSPSVPGCTPVIPEGHCCPTEYKCDHGENETQVPVSHSTENFDVTVISPSEAGEAMSSHAFETETTDDYNEDVTEDYETEPEETTLGTTADKQKITVELAEDSNLESISVIPEENIAVLVVTTDKNSDADETAFENTDGTRLRPDVTKLESDSINFSNIKHKTKVSTTRASTETESTRQPQDTTKPSTISQTNLKQKIKTSTTKHSSTENSGIGYSQDSTKPIAASLTNLKVKTKTSTTKVLATEPADDITVEATPYIHTTRNADPTTEPNEKYTVNEESDYNDEEKDNYAYDYVELYEDVPKNEQETFAPFAEYSETTYGERLTSTEETRGTIENRLKNKSKYPSTSFHTRNPTTQTVTTQETTANRLKNKNKNPSTSLHTRNPTTQTVTYFPNSKSATDRLNTERNAETVTNEGGLTDSTTTSEIGKSTSYPNRYTIYTSDKTHTPYIASTTGRQKQKTQPYYMPTHLASTQYSSLAQDTTPVQSRDPQISTRMSQTDEHKTTLEQIFNNTYVTNTGRPTLQFVKQSNKVISNHKQRPQRPVQTASSYKSTKPLPHDIATLLWSITQRYKPENQDSSTETYDPVVKQETVPSMFDHSGYLPDAQTFILAAPKLIVEDTTIENSYGTSQSDITNTDAPTTGSESSSSGSALPIFNFQSPDIIFSNHGPSSHRKQPPTAHDSDLPIVINNHKKSSTRIRPPIRFRPPSTPSVPQTSYVEISNHRPTNSFRRPPGKFPPYPSYNQRSEPEYRSQPNPRDPHHKLHRLDPDNHPEDYDEYYYDFEQGRNPSTKMFTNMQEYRTTGTLNVQTTDSETQYPGSSLQPSTRKKDLKINPVTVASRENNVRSTESEIYEDTTKVQTEDEVVGRSSENKVSTTMETTLQSEISTTPYPTTKSDFISTTKSFPKDPATDDEGKLFRAENNKHVEVSFIDHKHGQYEEKPNKFEVINGRFSPEKPTLKPLSSKPTVPLIQPNEPPQSEEDSKEINEVCFVDGRYYNSGEIIVKSNPCEMCRCFYGHPLCQVQQCPSPPEPSCVLEYLPGYCCPRVTCGVKIDSSQSSSDVSAPDPTGQEIRSPIITSDNQWKPLPHGPIVRPVENIPKLETSIPARIPDVVTAPPQFTQTEKKSQNNENTESKDDKVYIAGNLKYEGKAKSTTLLPHTSMIPTTITTAAPMTQSAATTTESATSELIPEVTTYFPDLPITTISFKGPVGPVFEPEYHSGNSQKNKSDIHDNSSGVRKVLGDTVILPPSKMSLSPSSGEDISTVLPVIHTLPTAIPNTEIPDLELDTVANIVLGDLPAELGGNLKVSGCNVYGKYYKISDKVTALSKPCSDCVCTVDGISCNTTC